MTKIMNQSITTVFVQQSLVLPLSAYNVFKERGHPLATISSRIWETTKSLDACG